MAAALTTHVLDTGLGIPARDLTIRLFRLDDSGRVPVQSCRTNADGRTDDPILSSDAFQRGTYELVFEAGVYLNKTGRGGFLEDIPIRFTISEDSHYHVPLLLSPFGYTTYRGS